MAEAGKTKQTEQEAKQQGKAAALPQEAAEPQRHFVYMLRCRDGSLYTGWTTHLQERVWIHNQGKGAKYTRSRRPVELVYWEEYPDKSQALRREREIKGLDRQEKQRLIAGGAGKLDPCPFRGGS